MTVLHGKFDRTAVLWAFGGLAGALVILAGLSSVLLIIGKADPLQTFRAMYRGAFGSRVGFGETLIRFAPVTLIALGLVPSLRIGLFNIGAPGQIGMGALCASLISFSLAGLSSPFVLAAAFVAGCAGGAVWALVPGVLRAWLRVNEILSTLVFNFLGVLFLQYLLTGPLHGHRANLPQSDPLPDAAWLPVWLPGTRAHAGLFLVLLAAIVLAAIQRSPAGFRLRLFGASPSLARQAGVNGRTLILGTMGIGGAAAGAAGWMQVAGVDHRLYATVADPIGYMGLFAALLGVLRPSGVLLAGFTFAALLRGGESLQIGAGVSPEIINALVGLILLLIAGRFGRLGASL